MRIPYTSTNDNITVFHGGKVFNIPSTNRKFAELKEHLKSGAHDIEYIETIVNVRSMVERFSKGNVKIYGNEVYYKGQLVRTSITSRLIEHLDMNYEVDTWLNFMENVMQNPSNDSRERLFDFLEKNGSPLTEDGHFLAFKRVRGDFLDHYTGKMDNSPGKIVQVDRSMVDSNNRNTCSHGLHVCASVYLTESGYADSYDAKTIVCKVNPRDVVAVPPDYNETKMRVCRYEVISEVELGSIHEVESQDIAFGYVSNGVFDDPKDNVIDVKSDIEEAILDFMSNEIKSIDGSPLEYEVKIENHNNTIEIIVSGDLEDFFSDADVMIDWFKGCADMEMIIRKIVMENDPEMEYADHVVVISGLDINNGAKLEVYDGYGYLSQNGSNYDVVMFHQDEEEIREVFVDFYRDCVESIEDEDEDVQDDVQDDVDYDYFEKIEILNAISEELSNELGIRIEDVDIMSGNIIHVDIDIMTRVDQVSIANTINFLKEFSDVIYKKIFDDSRIGADEVVINFADFNEDRDDNVLFTYINESTIRVADVFDTYGTECCEVSNANEAYDAWLQCQDVVFEDEEDEDEYEDDTEMKYFQATNGDTYSEREIMEGIAYSGSLNEFSRRHGLARSTVQGWVKKILG